jgi:hypothetical protein
VATFGSSIAVPDLRFSAFILRQNGFAFAFVCLCRRDSGFAFPITAIPCDYGDSGDLVAYLPLPPSSQSIPTSSQSVPSSSQSGRPNRSQPRPNRPNAQLTLRSESCCACFSIPALSAIPVIAAISGMGSKVCADTVTRLLTTGKIRGIEEMPHFWARKPRAYKDQRPTTNYQLPKTKYLGFRQFSVSPCLRSPVKQNLTIKIKIKSATFLPSSGLNLCPNHFSFHRFLQNPSPRAPQGADSG